MMFIPKIFLIFGLISCTIVVIKFRKEKLNIFFPIHRKTEFGSFCELDCKPKMHELIISVVYLKVEHFNKNELFECIR